MNPFKQKQLDEFTVTDCEQYIAHYPYGEHIIEVKRHLKQLRAGGKKKRVAVSNEFMGDTPPQRSEPKSRKKKSARPRINETQRVSTNNYTVTSSNSKVDDSGKMAKNILMWILIIVGVFIAGTILIIIIEAMFPGIKLNSGLLKYAIYPALLCVGKWIKDQFE